MFTLLFSLHRIGDNLRIVLHGTADEQPINYCARRDAAKWQTKVIMSRCSAETNCFGGDVGFFQTKDFGSLRIRTGHFLNQYLFYVLYHSLIMIISQLDWYWHGFCSLSGQPAEATRHSADNEPD